MRLVVLLAFFCFGLISAFESGELRLGPASSYAFNPLKYCVDKCVNEGTISIDRCEKKQCAEVKTKAGRKRCERSCNKPQGLLKYCDTTCKKSQMCTRGLEMKACLKEKCDPYKKSDIRRYIKCKNEECGTICKN